VRGAIGEMDSELPASSPLVATRIRLPPEMVPSVCAPIPPFAYSSLLSYTLPGPQPHTFNEIRTHEFPRIKLPPLSPINRPTPSSILPGPYVTLGAGRFQLSDAALGGLDMKLYVSRVCRSSVGLTLFISRLAVLCRSNKLGVRLTSEKQRALLRGDASGAVIHPFFVHCAQVLGMYFCDGMEGSPIMIQLHAKYARMGFDSLVDVFKIRDWELMAQAGAWLMAASIVLRLGETAHVHIRTCCEAVNTGRLQFIPTYGQPPEFSEDLHEKLCVLSQIIYFENFSFLTCGGAKPTMTARIEMEFKHQLRVWPFTSLSSVAHSAFPHRMCIRYCSKSVR